MRVILPWIDINNLVTQKQLWTTNGEVILPEPLRLTQGQKLKGAWGRNVTKNLSQIQDKGHLSLRGNIWLQEFLFILLYSITF